MTTTPTCQQEISLNFTKDQILGIKTQNYFSDCSKSVRRIVNQLLWYHSRGLTIRVSQKTMGAKSGITREQANRIIQDLCADGFIASKKRRYNNTNIYQLNTLFDNPTVQLYLDKFFPVLRSLGSSRSKPAFPKNVTLYRKENINKKSKSIFIYNPNPILSYISSTYIRKKSFMYDEAPPYELKNIKLTAAGYIRLSCFPQIAIQEGDRILKSLKDVRDPFRVLFSLCTKICREKKLPVDMEKLRRLSQQAGITEETPLYISRPVVTVTPKETIQKREHARNEHQSYKQTAERVKTQQDRINKEWHAQQGFKQIDPVDIPVTLTVEWVQQKTKEGYFTPFQAELLLEVAKGTTNEQRRDNFLGSMGLSLNGDGQNLTLDKRKQEFGSPVLEEEETSFEFGF